MGALGIWARRCGPAVSRCALRLFAWRHVVTRALTVGVACDLQVESGCVVHVCRPGRVLAEVAGGRDEIQRESPSRPPALPRRVALEVITDADLFLYQQNGWWGFTFVSTVIQVWRRERATRVDPTDASPFCLLPTHPNSLSPLSLFPHFSSDQSSTAMVSMCVLHPPLNLAESPPYRPFNMKHDRL